MRRANSLAKRAGAALYRRVPAKTRGSFEQFLSPLSFRFFTRGANFFQKLPLSAERPVSIVIPSYNDLAMLKPLISSIEKTCSSFEYEIIVSDDYCQSSNTSKLLELQTNKIKVVTHHERTGFAGAVNRGMKVARWDVVLLNSDMLALPHWLNNLQYAAYEIDPKIGLVSPHLLYPTGRIQYGGTFHLRVNAPQWFSHLDQGRVANYRAANTQKYIKGISGAAVYIKHEVIEQIGLFDDKYWLGFEDVDYAYKARAAGFRCYLESRAKLVHLESASRGKVQGPKEYASMRRFWDKWKSQNLPGNEGNIHLLLDRYSPQILHNAAENIKASIESHSDCIVEIHFLNLTNGRDEDVIFQLKDRPKRVISLDRTSLTTNWLSTETAGSSWIFFPDFELSDFDLENPEHIAQLQPEFGYIPTSTEQAQRYKDIIPWHVSLSISPVFKSISSKIEQTAGSKILLIDAPKEMKDQFASLSASFGKGIISISSEDIARGSLTRSDCEEISIAVAFTIFLSSTVPLFLFANEVCLISQFSEYSKFEVLDGYNSFTFAPGDKNRAIELTKQLLLDQEYQKQIKSNARSTVIKLFEQQGIKILEVLSVDTKEILPL